MKSYIANRYYQGYKKLKQSLMNCGPADPGGVGEVGVAPVGLLKVKCLPPLVIGQEHNP